jgi:hypothetical protein
LEPPEDFGCASPQADAEGKSLEKRGVFRIPGWDRKELPGLTVEGSDVTKRLLSPRVASCLCCIVWLVLATGCETPVSVEPFEPGAARRQLTANVLTANDLSPSARNVLRRWVLSEHYDSDPEGAIAAMHTIAAEGRGGEDEVITLAEMAYLHGEKSQQRPYFLAAAIYSFVFLFPETGQQPPSPYDPRLRLAADLYSLGITHGFASADGATVEFKSGGYELPFGRLYVAVNPSGFEWHNRRILAVAPVQEIDIHGLANRYRHPGIGAPLAATTQPIVAERGMQGGTSDEAADDGSAAPRRAATSARAEGAAGRARPVQHLRHSHDNDRWPTRAARGG